VDIPVGRGPPARGSLRQLAKRITGKIVISAGIFFKLVLIYFVAALYYKLLVLPDFLGAHAAFA
jgi:hypothetical protein